MNKAECISQVDIFSNLPRRLLRQVSGICRERRYPADRIILKEGAEGMGLFFLVEGKVEVFGTTRSGKRRRLAILGAGEYFGEMMVLDKQPRSASVRSLEPCLCYIMAEWDFRRLLKKNPDIAVKMLPTLVRRIRELDKSLLQ